MKYIVNGKKIRLNNYVYFDGDRIIMALEVFQDQTDVCKV